MDQIKGAFKSKTVWFALLLAVASWFQDSLVAGGVQPEDLGVVGTVISLIMVALRAVTNKPLQDK